MLVRELRIKLDITKAGLAADRTMQVINYGLENSKSDGKSQKRSH